MACEDYKKAMEELIVTYSVPFLKKRLRVYCPNPEALSHASKILWVLSPEAIFISRIYIPTTSSIERAFLRLILVPLLSMA